MGEMCGQASLLDLIEPDPVPLVDASKLRGFTLDVSDTGELVRFELEWQRAYDGQPWWEWKRFPGWRVGWLGASPEGSAHGSIPYSADLRNCLHRNRLVAERRADPCQCVGGFLSRVYCCTCRWWTSPHEREQDAVEEYLDHCWPRWRSLPVLTRKTDKSGMVSAVIPDNYPTAWQTPGAPVRTWRTPPGTRHAPGGSPYGGYDVAVIRESETS